MRDPDRKDVKWSPRPRAVFAPEDYAVIRKALSVYHYNYNDSLTEEEKRQISSLLHRLGRIHP